MKKEEFLQLPTESNEQFVTERILTDFTPDQINVMIDTFQQLDKSLYKSWAKDMPFAAIKSALEHAGELANAEASEPEDTTLDMLKKAILAKDIPAIKSVYDLLGDHWFTPEEEGAKLLDGAKQVIKEQLSIELNKAITDKDYRAFVEAWELLGYESEEEKETEALWNKALDTFITSAKIEVRTLPGENVIKEYPFADRIIAAHEYEKMTEGHAFNAYDFITNHPGVEAQYLYVLVLIDIHGKQYTTGQLGSLTAPEL
ncbi:hypothetical protein [Chitinophaga tropicalis]|uniref:Uncharacterized protein n=1 Tax=Chitinophaga tropicalis TaxID=2683588 RepID=A0A7K1UEU4_9BACT|nr:hypothetical protein [Chitinophaga tropicalis]MVT12495.1 hypothetical protein [Chitinophaga tropicalis]